MKKSLIICSLLLICLAVSTITEAGQVYQLARIYIDQPSQIDQIRRLHLDVVWVNEKFIEIVTDEAELLELESYGFRMEVIHEDLTAFFKSRFDERTGFLSLSQIESEMNFMNLLYPDIVGVRQVIGQSLEGRNMYALKVSDNPEIDEDEPELLFTACIHAREGITPLVLLHYINYMGENYGIDSEVTDLVDNREIWFVLVVNPDGYAYNDFESPGGGGMWRKNRRDNGDGTFGVDLNRNFGYMWGYDDIGSSPDTDDPTYRGTGPFSEPETQVMRDFTIAHEFVLTVYYHSYSNLVLFPWSYAEGLYTPDHHLFQAMGNTVYKMNGYSPGPGWFLYPTNGDSDDWNYGEQTLKDKCYGMTFEVGTYSDYFWPPTNRIDDLIAENLDPLLYLTWAAGDINAVLVPEAPLLNTPDSADISTPYELSWSHDDTLNPAVKYELVEMSDRGIATDDASDFNNWDNTGFVLDSWDHSYPTSFYSERASTLIRYLQTKHAYTVRPGDSLKFWTRYDISEYWDFAYVEVSTDGINFDPIPGNITTDSDPYGGHNRGHGITGWSTDWVEAKFDLSAYEGEDINIRFLYKEHDTLYAWWGWHIDDIYPVLQFDYVTVLDSNLTDTSFTVAGHPEGIYYYKIRACDADGHWSAYTPIKKIYVGQPVEFICGDFDGNQVINFDDYTAMHYYLYNGGPPPEFIEQGDADGCGTINVADYLYLYDYLYLGGTEPCHPGVICDHPTGNNRVDLGCPVYGMTMPDDDTLAVPVYLTTDVTTKGFNLGFIVNDPIFEILAVDFSSSEIPEPGELFADFSGSLSDRVLIGHHANAAYGPVTDKLIGEINILIPGETPSQSFDIDSLFLAPAGEFVLVPPGGGTIKPAYNDCGTEDIVILPEFVCGDANSDDTVNILDITFLIVYLYQGGEAPENPVACDVNHSGDINILDITYLINFLYMSGPDPECI